MTLLGIQIEIGRAHPHIKTCHIYSQVPLCGGSLVALDNFNVSPLVFWSAFHFPPGKFIYELYYLKMIIIQKIWEN